MSHIDLNPYAIVALVLLVCAYVATWPAGRARLRRYDLARVRRARRSEDAAWRRRDAEAMLARKIHWDRYDVAASLGGHSLSARERHVYEPVEGTNLIVMDPATHRARSRLASARSTEEANDHDP
jgi:hypothetical protein